MVKSFAAGDSAITAIAASKESIAFADESGSLRICNLADGKLLHKLKEDAPVTALAISPDGKRFASATSNKVVRLWSSDPKKSVELKGDRYADEAVQAGERMLALAGKEIDFRKSALKTAQTQQSNQLARVEKAGKTNDVVAKAFTEKETKLASAKEARTSAEKGLQELQEKLSKLTNSVAAAAKDDPKEPAEKATTAETSKEATAVTNAPDARLVAEVKQKVKETTEKLTSASNVLATAEKEFKKAELTKSIAAHELELGTNSLLKPEQAVTDAKASLTKSEDTEKQKQAALEKFKERAASASSTTLTLAFSPDSQVLASAGDDSAVHTWSAETGAAFDVYRSKAGPLERLTFSGTNGIEAASAKSLFQSSLMPIWRLERTIGKPRPDSPLADRVNAVRFSPDGQLLASGGGEPSRSGEIKLWSVADGKLARDLPGIHSDTVFSLDFSPDGKLLASGAADKFLRVSSVISGKLLKNFEGHTHHVLGVSWKQDGRTLVSAGADGLVKVWNFTTGEKLKNIEGFGKEVTSASFVGITDQLLASAGDGQFKLLRENGETVRSFSGSGEYPYCSAATPDGKVVVAGGLDGVLRVWNGADGKTIAEFAR